MNDKFSGKFSGKLSDDIYIEEKNLLIDLFKKIEVLEAMIQAERFEREEDAMRLCSEINSLTLQGCCCLYHEKPLD